MVRPRYYNPFLIVCLLLLAAFLARGIWLPWIGEALVRNEGPAKADLAVVLAGDYAGHRIEMAAQLVRQGYVPVVLVDGPDGAYGNRESDMAIAFITREGYPKEWFVSLPMSAHSTEEEAGYAIAELERRHTGSFLLVTSEYHSARAARTFRKMLRKRGDGAGLRVVTSRDEFFQPAGWWREREGRKATLLEWTKTVAAVLGM